jgi:hypothetical protein
MKCVKEKKTGVIIRVSNDRAAQLVAAGGHTYSSKDAHKRQIKGK